MDDNGSNELLFIFNYLSSVFINVKFFVNKFIWKKENSILKIGKRK